MKTFKVAIEQPIPNAFAFPGGDRVFAILIGADVLLNACTGGAPYQTISCRIGESIRSGGWASRVPWPKWWVSHCLGSVFETTV